MNKSEGLKVLLFPDSGPVKIPYSYAEELLEITCEPMVRQFNKLRESYKEIYLFLKSELKKSQLSNYKLFFRRMELDSSVFMDDEESIDFPTYQENKTPFFDDVPEQNDCIENSYRERIVKVYADGRISTLTKTQKEDIEPGFSGNGKLSQIIYLDLLEIGEEPGIMNLMTTQVKTGATKKHKIDQKFVIEKIGQTMESISNNIHELWDLYLKLLNLDTDLTSKFLKQKYKVHYIRMIKMRSHIKKVDWIHDPMEDDVFLQEIHRSKKIRSKFNSFYNDETARGLWYLFGHWEGSYQHVFLEEIYEPEEESFKFVKSPRVRARVKMATSKSYSISSSSSSSTSNNNDVRPHVVFMWHGYNGEPTDLKYIYNAIIEKDPSAIVHSWVSFSENRNHSLLMLGELVAEEILSEVEKIKDDNEIHKITLIGYSMGGLVLRAALPYLKSLKKYLNTFMTLATPHLGYLTTKNKLLTVGMYVASNVNYKLSIAEIMIADSAKMKDWALYLLSQERGLEWFDSSKFLYQKLVLHEVFDCFSD